ncbi:MAG TPA: J domain-containing protein [Afifellaceae bacterium]|nr:J domain-containing protein [Afifellaceae bacterium]
MTDPYKVLGISKNADEAAIKRAFRKLAKENHPDRHAGDTKAKDKFSKINAAYEILKDKEKRAAYDRGEIDAEGKPRFTGFNRGAGEGFGGFDPGMYSETRSGPGGHTRTFHFGTDGGGSGLGGDADDILRSFFTGTGRRGAAQDPFSARPSRGGDVEASVAVTLEDIAAGNKMRVSLPTGKTVALNLPAGVADGQVIRLKGQGEASLSGGPAGDALVTVRLVRHPLFSAEGANLRLDHPINLDQAVLGDKITVPTLTGKVQISVPPYSSSGKSLRLKGKGLPGKSGNGDLLVTLRIVLPEEPDKALDKLMKNWRDKR